MTDFILACIAIVAFFVAVTVVTIFVLAVAFLIMYWRDYGG